MEYKVLSNGIKIPKLGYGVYQIPDLDECEKCVVDAIKNGYRLIDTAEKYFNEEAVGNGIIKSKIDRKEIFITTKVWFGQDNYNRTINTVKTALKKLKTDYIDLVLIHQPYGDYYAAWKALEEMYENKIIRSIGVSNFHPDRVVDLCLNAKIKPMINQIEMNPFFQRENDIEWNNKYGVLLEAWAPFGEGRNDMFNQPVLKEIASKYNKTVAQVILRWLMQKDVITIPKTINESRMIENISIFDFQLSNEDMGKIKKMNNDKSLFVDHRDPERIEWLQSF